jgi:thiol-disulfide isomerase/thioredoxin
MVLTASTNRELGGVAPNFALPDFDGRIVALGDFPDAKALLVVFWSNHCPFVKHIKAAFAAFAREYQPKGLAVVAINANDTEAYPEDRPEQMKADAARFGFTFDYVLDETQNVARAYDAACTPEFFLFDRDRKLVYHGQFDASRPRNALPITGEDLRAAADAALAGKPLHGEQTPSIGCNIKWNA